MKSQTVLERVKRDSVNHHNVLMSLPTSLVHCILSDWVEVVSVIKLDFALAGSRQFHSLLLDIIKANQFMIKEVKQAKYGPQKCANSRMLSWLTFRDVKVLAFELHEKCESKTLETYLQRFGKYVQSACPSIDANQRSIPSQSVLFAKYCINLTNYVSHSCTHILDGSVLYTIINNVQLKKLDLYGMLHAPNFLSNCPGLTLPNLKIIKRGSTYGFDKSLTDLVKIAPDFQALSIYCNPYKCVEIDDVILDVAEACSQLRTFCCNELHLGSRDRFLKPFLAVCSDIVNLSLYRHAGLTDDVLIEALSELTSLQALDLRGCCQLTDRTLAFLAHRFATTLKVLYVDHSTYPNYYFDEEEEEEEEVKDAYQDIYEGYEEEEEKVEEEVEEQNCLVQTGGVSDRYTAAGIASLRAQCTQLHTFHYTIEAGTVTLPKHIEAYQNATIVKVCDRCDEVVALILEPCHQMQILAMPYDEYGEKRIWLSVEQLMTIAAHSPQLRTVVSEKKKYQDHKEEVDYSAVRKAFPKLVFTDNIAAANFDVSDIPF